MGPARLRAVLGESWPGPAGEPEEIGGGVRPAALVGVLAVVVVAIAVAWWGLWRGQPRAEPLTPLTPLPALTPSIAVSGSPRPGSATGPPWAAGVSPGSVSPGGVSPGALVVHVAGKVRRPGLVRLTAGARVADAIAAAGGLLPGVDPASLNFARPVVDGEQVAVGVPGAPPAPAAPGPGASGAAGAGGAGGVIDLNTATLDQLDSLPGVGPVLAQRILDWRAEHGRFGSVEDLRQVSGIGESKFADIKPRVRV